MRERRKEPREGSEIDPETACIQTVGAPAQWAFGSFEERGTRDSKELKKEIDSDEYIKARVTSNWPRSGQDESGPCTMDSSRVHRAGVTAYLLYNGSATYVV